MVENPLAFEFSKTRTICDAFDEAWAFLQGLGSELTEASNSLATQTILAKRIIEMADQGLRDIPELRDDALAFLEHSPPSAWRNSSGRTIGAQTASLAELSRAGSVGETPQPAATGAHSTAGMGQSREETPSNSNFLAALHSGLEQAHEVRGGPQMVLQASGLGGEGSVQHRDHSVNARAQMGPEPSRRRPGRGINGEQRRGAYIFTASIVVLIVVAFLVKWWLA